MRIIILGLSSCLAGCGGLVPVVTDTSPAGNDPNPSVTTPDTGKTMLVTAIPIEQDQSVLSDIVLRSALQMPALAGAGIQLQPPAPTVGFTALDEVPPPAAELAASGDLYALSTEPVRASAPRYEPPSTQVSYGRTDDEAEFVNTSFEDGKLFSVDTSFTRKKQQTDLALADDSERGFWHMKVALPGSGLEAEYAQSSFDPHTSEGFGTTDNRLVRLSASTDFQGFALGLGYQSVGTGFEFGGKTATGRKKVNQSPLQKMRQGREGTEAWVSRQFGDLGIKTLAGMYQDRSVEDNSTAQFTTYKVGGSLNYTLLAWPTVGVTLDYGSGYKNSDKNSAYAGRQIDVENVATSLYYADDRFNGTLYVENATGEGTDTLANIQTWWVGGSYYPNAALTLTPSLSYVRQDYTDYDVSTDSWAASMTASVKPHPRSRFNFVGYSEYSTEENQDWYMDSSYRYTSLGINWDAGRSKSFIRKWALELYQDQYTDNLYSENDAGGLGVMLLLKTRGEDSARPRAGWALQRH